MAMKVVQQIPLFGQSGVAMVFLKILVLFLNKNKFLFLLRVFLSLRD
jgi:hypothetical protein